MQQGLFRPHRMVAILALLHGTGVVPASQEGDLPGMWDDDGRVLDPRLYCGGRGPSWHVG